MDLQVTIKNTFLKDSHAIPQSQIGFQGWKKSTDFKKSPKIEDDSGKKISNMQSNSISSLKVGNCLAQP